MNFTGGKFTFLEYEVPAQRTSRARAAGLRQFHTLVQSAARADGIYTDIPLGRVAVTHLPISH